MTNGLETYRSVLARALDWKEAHVGFDAAVKGLPVALRGRRPKGFSHSPWELLEHLRMAQWDLFDFCRNPHYKAGKWPEDYWPAGPKPPKATSWSASVAAFRRDREELKKLVLDPRVDLSGAIPHGEGRTYLRSILLVIDHSAYHVGQLVTVRMCLGAWSGG